MNNSPATEKQVSYLKDLVTKRDPEDMNVKIVKVLMGRDDLTVTKASECISVLLQLPVYVKPMFEVVGSVTVTAVPEAKPVSVSDWLSAQQYGVYDTMPHKPLTEFISGRFFIIYKNKYGKSGVKRLYKSYNTKSGYSWKKGSIYTLKSFDTQGKLTYLDKSAVQAVGKHFNFCMMCGATLTDPESQKEGVGPVCLQKFFGK